MTRTFSLCSARAQETVQKAMGAGLVFAAPPIASYSGILSTEAARQADLLYFRLHGSPDQRVMWYGEEIKDRWTPALHASEVDGLDMRGQLVLAGTCWGMTSAFVGAFTSAGADFIGGYGFNYAASSTSRVIGTDKLAEGVLAGLKLGLSHAGALRYGKTRLLATAWRRADRDALRFTMRRST
jgi:hypothetical protein